MEKFEVIRDGRKTTGHQTLKEIGLEEGHTIEVNEIREEEGKQNEEEEELNELEAILRRELERL